MKRSTFILTLCTWILAMGGSLITNTAMAQATDKPIKIVVGFPPGGSADVIARLMAERMQSSMGQNVIVENRAGASGRIAIDAIKASTPDGNSLIIMPSGPVVIFPHVFKKLSYDPVADFVPVSMAALMHHGLAVGPMVPASVTDVKGFVAAFQ